jgi:PAS domain S-box-containing protein
MLPTENIYRTVLETMEHGFVFLDTEGRIISFNAAACRILGLTAEQITGRSTYDPAWQTIRENGEDFPAHFHPVIVSIRTGSPCYGVVMGVRTGRDADRWLLINSDAVRNEQGEIIGAVASFSDITLQISQKRYLEEALREKNAAVNLMERNSAYLADSLVALAREIMDAASRTSGRLAGGAPGEALDDTKIIAEKAERMVRLLTSSKS